MEHQSAIKALATSEWRRGLPCPNLTSRWAGTFGAADTPASVGSVVDILGELAEDDVEWLLTAGRCRELQAGEFLITRGLEADGLFERWVRKFCDVGNPYRIQRLATLGGGFREDPRPGRRVRAGRHAPHLR